jgi:hypothetical protein
MAYHFCQVDDSATCHVPELVRNIAAQLTKAIPQYANYLIRRPALAALLTLDACYEDSMRAMRRAILAPLVELRAAKAMSFDDVCIIAIDGLGDAEYHRADHGDTVAAFLHRVVKILPPWLKFVCSIRTGHQELTAGLKFPAINLDLATGSSNEHIHRDIEGYVAHRARTSDELMNNVAMDSYDFGAFGKFAAHLESLSGGSLLYCRLVLDLIEQGQLVLKSTNYRILPVNLSEVFLLMANLRFPTVRSFERMLPVLDVCLASLYPLTSDQLYDIGSSATFTLPPGVNLTPQQQQQQLDGGLGSGVKEDFVHRLHQICPSLLYRRRDSRYVFMHAALREWFIGRRERQSQKFQCDIQ